MTTRVMPAVGGKVNAVGQIGMQRCVCIYTYMYYMSGRPHIKVDVSVCVCVCARTQCGIVEHATGQGEMGPANKQPAPGSS